jgi:MoxR-like ATPase
VSKAGSATEMKTRERRKPGKVKFDYTHKRFKAIAKCVEIGHNVYLKGPAGSGKTTIGKQIADLFEKPFYMIGRVDDIFALTGYRDASGEFVETDFYRAFTQGGVFLGDEMDRWAAEALTGLNAALANGWMAFPNGRHEAHEDFIFLGAGNTDGRGHDRVYTAAQALDGATMDRFTKIELNYDEDLERKLALAVNAAAGEWVDFVQKARANAEKHRMDVIISPRASVSGAELLAAGFPMDAVKTMTFMNGLNTNERNQLEA